MAGDRSKDSEPVVANVHYGGNYMDKLVQAAASGACIFCDERWLAGMLCRHDGWGIRLSEYPMKDRQGNAVAHHFLVVPLHHQRDVTSADWQAISWLIGWAKENFGITGGCLTLRDGDPLFSGRTVMHAHVHYVVPNVIDGAAIPADFPVG
jgi:hypothetical protein